MRLYQQLLELRHREIIPRLPGTRALGTDVLADGALSARWRMGDGSLLRIDLNLSAESIAHRPPVRARLLFESTTGTRRQLDEGHLAPYSALVTLTPGDVMQSPTGEHL